MGLDITAYQQLTWNRPALCADDYDYPVQTNIRAAPYFAERLGSMKPGIYDVDGEVFCFRAGSYSGYNWWRSRLAELVGTTDNEVWNGLVHPEAFEELISFSDCEGTIGHDVAAKLAKDFNDWYDKAEKFSKEKLNSFDGERWLNSYNDWKRAFNLAAAEGAVCFH